MKVGKSDDPLFASFFLRLCIAFFFFFHLYVRPLLLFPTLRITPPQSIDNSLYFRRPFSTIPNTVTHQRYDMVNSIFCT
ncbi:hypothetical protein F4811DRAFT_28167 [Daldinia bambusicola]|nr:hypothetical protein F4811DRAFT_28167 [Daldinia bambusicola]